MKFGEGERAPIDVTPGRLSARERAVQPMMLGGFLLGICLSFMLGTYSVWLVPIGLLGVFGAMFWLGQSIGRRGREEVESRDWKVCLRCRYPLVRRSDVGWGCPECGGHWDIAALEKSWRWTYRNPFYAPTASRGPTQDSPRDQ